MLGTTDLRMVQGYQEALRREADQRRLAAKVNAMQHGTDRARRALRLRPSHAT